MKNKTEKGQREQLERLIIAWLIMDYDWLVDYMTIETSDFTPKYREIIKVIKENWTADPIITANKCKSITLEELREIAWEILGTSEFENYVEELKDIIAREKIENKLNKLSLMIKSGTSLNEVYKELNNLKSEWEIWTDLQLILYELLEESNWERKVKIVPTGYRDLDMLVWWLEAGQVIVIGARPWMWKSMLAINMISNNIKNWEKTALFSMEMNNKQILRRLLAMNSWVGVRKIKTKTEWEVKERVAKWYKKLSEQLENLYIFDNLRTISDIERKIRQLVRKYWVGIFYIDYIQLIKNPAIKNNPIESLTDISQRLKQIALELGITIIELSQLNRESDKSVIKKASQLRWSGSIEQDADMVRILDKLDENIDKIQISVQKCRDWRIWDVELKQISDIMLITDLPPKPF